MSEQVEIDKRQRVLAAAIAVFGRYGYRRTSMEDIAAEAGISRPALYLLFQNKKDVFRSAAAGICAGGIERAAAALQGPGPFGKRLVDALIRRNAEPFRLAASLAHGEELLSQNNEIAGDIMAETDSKAATLFAAAFRDADAKGEVNLARAGLAAERVAALLLSSATGLKGAAAASADAYEQSLRDAATLVLAAVAPLAKR